MASRPLKKLIADLGDLAAAPDANGAASQALLREALASSHQRAVVQAAELIAKHGATSLAPALLEAYRAFAGAKAEQDAGCLAKEALVTALEALESNDAGLFAAAAGCVQLERSKNQERDTAARVRARGLIGLARVGHPDFLVLAGAALGDRDASLRLTAARVIGHRGQYEGAGLLLLRLNAVEELPEVASECLRSLLVLAPEHAMRYAANALRVANDAEREHLLHALGSANDERAIELLTSELDRVSLATDRAQVIEAIGLSRRASARGLLLTLLRESAPAEANVALSALAIHRYDPRLREQLIEGSAHSRELSRRVRELLGD